MGGWVSAPLLVLPDARGGVFVFFGLAPDRGEDVPGRADALGEPVCVVRGWRGECKAESGGAGAQQNERAHTHTFALKARAARWLVAHRTVPPGIQPQTPTQQGHSPETWRKTGSGRG